MTAEASLACALAYRERAENYRHLAEIALSPCAKARYEREHKRFSALAEHYEGAASSTMDQSDLERPTAPMPATFPVIGLTT